MRFRGPPRDGGCSAEDAFWGMVQDSACAGADSCRPSQIARSSHLTSPHLCKEGGSEKRESQILDLSISPSPEESGKRTYEFNIWCSA